MPSRARLPAYRFPTGSRPTPRRGEEAQTGHQEAELDKEEARKVLSPYEDPRENFVLFPYGDLREDFRGEEMKPPPNLLAMLAAAETQYRGGGGGVSQKKERTPARLSRSAGQLVQTA